MSDDALIHLRVPAALKARWVRESRAAGMRLTDWIVENVEKGLAMTIYRACYYKNPVTGQETVLTKPEQSELPDEELIESAVAAARDASLLDDDGEWPRLSEAQLREGLVIGEWRP